MRHAHVRRPRRRSARAATATPSPCWARMPRRGVHGARLPARRRRRCSRRHRGRRLARCSAPRGRPVRRPWPARRPYRLRVRWADGSELGHRRPLPLRPGAGRLDAWLLAEGSHLRPYEMLGARPRTHGRRGRHALRRVGAERLARQRGRRLQLLGRPPPPDAAAPRVRRVGALPARRGPGRALQVRTAGRDGRLLPQKADPYARQAELRPATASVVAEMPPVAPPSPARQAANALDAPISIYEVHLGSAGGASPRRATAG
jgi:hypothetical protein